MNRLLLTFVVTLMPVAVTLLFIANHAYVELPSAIAATSTIAIAAISCLLNAFIILPPNKFFAGLHRPQRHALHVPDLSGLFLSELSHPNCLVQAAYKKAHLRPFEAQMWQLAD